MPFPIIPAVLGVSTVVGGHFTRATVTLGISKGVGQFAGSLPFGAGYSLGTYLGFPKNFQVSSGKDKRKSYYLNTMPYGYYPRRRYSRYGRRYGRRYSRYGRRYYRRYV